MAFIGTFSPDVPITNRNLIINGAMQIAQRNTSVAGITTTGYYTADRMQIGLSSAGTWTMNVESSAPDDTEFRKSANVKCTTADASLSAGDFLTFTHKIEGQNLQGIKKGTVNAESLTVSFYVKSSNTGTYICEFADDDNTRQISKSYTINTANTWEKKTITVPPDATGKFDNDNASSLQLVFFLAAGTTFTSGALNSSAFATSVNANRAVGQLNLANLAGNYWAVTGIQLEIGETATNFEMRSFGQELSLCQRYYQKILPGGTSVNFASGFASTTISSRYILHFVTSTRIPPTALETSGTAADYAVNSGGAAPACNSVPVFFSASTSAINFTADVASGLTAGNGALLRLNGTTNGFLAWSAEL